MIETYLCNIKFEDIGIQIDTDLHTFNFIRVKNKLHYFLFDISENKLLFISTTGNTIII